MRVLMLSWEYPPRIVGGLGRHVHALARHLAAQGHDVHVITRNHPDAPAEEVREGVHVVRVRDAPPVIPFDDLVAWTLAFNTRVQSAAARLLRHHDIDVIHAHDWLVAHAAIGLVESFDLPLVTTIHATEFGRHQGHLPEPMNVLIHECEQWLTGRAQRVLTCSQYMRRQVTELFGLPEPTTHVIPNSVDARDFAVDPGEVAAFRAAHVPDGARMLLFAGRLEYDKGVQTLLMSLRRIANAVGPVILVVAGVGTYAPQLRRQVEAEHLTEMVRFAGFLGDHRLRLHYAAADVLVAPSIYEPFGLVAIEAMACSTPVVVADTGGLAELVPEGQGLRFAPRDGDQLAAHVTAVLTDERLAARLVANGRRGVETRDTWAQVAHRTAQIYRDASAAMMPLDQPRPGRRSPSPGRIDQAAS